jgi:hypothetical protein
VVEADGDDNREVVNQSEQHFEEALDVEKEYSTLRDSRVVKKRTASRIS